jgi:phosphopantothenoylcysteine decarboxylase/phosphopantothenate--cysteine ligase
VTEKRKILLGVTGSVAAIKAPIIARTLMRHDTDVTCIVTESAERFTTSYALSVVTHNETISKMFLPHRSTWHIHLGRSVDAMLIAPASATTLGKLRYGIYDNPVLLAASALPRTTPLVVAPAMDEEMWFQPAVQDTVRWLGENGINVIEPINGDLASGLVGRGRIKEPDELVDEFFNIVNGSRQGYISKTTVISPLAGKKVLISGGPTYERIDPVRFIGNRSSGKMAAALADTAANIFGASVTLIMGPSHIEVSSLVNRINVESTDEMSRAMMQQMPGSDVVIMSAAVSDFRPMNPISTKMKKSDQKHHTLELVPTNDILTQLSQIRRDDQLLVGFALESRASGEEYAKDKLRRKKLDMIVLNHYDEEGAGMSSETNHITLYSADGSKTELPMMSKKECASAILETIEKFV